ncbi:MAG: hypothetical protein AAB512_03840 [Patescibacteria group bacterium]
MNEIYAQGAVDEFKVGNPGHPEWKSWWIRFMQFDGVQLRLSDVRRVPKEIAAIHSVTAHKYELALGPETCVRHFSCRQPQAPHFAPIWVGDDLAEANKAFDLRARRIVQEAEFPK